MMNTHGQLAHSVNTPPRNTPAVPPAGAAAPYRARALPSSFGLWPNSIMSKVIDAGAISAPPTPCTARPATSTHAL